jgi:hypothetical protein
MLDTRSWHSVWGVTLKLKKARLCKLPRPTTSCDSGSVWIRLDELECKRAFRHFINLLNRAVYNHAFHRHGKRMNVIPVLEKERSGRWHYHLAIEPPTHLSPEIFTALIIDCWLRTDWAFPDCLVQQNPDAGWNNYILKLRQKTELETWFDCIDLNCLTNTFAGA